MCMAKVALSCSGSSKARLSTEASVVIRQNYEWAIVWQSEFTGACISSKDVAKTTTAGGPLPPIGLHRGDRFGSAKIRPRNWFRLTLALRGSGQSARSDFRPPYLMEVTYRLMAIIRYVTSGSSTARRWTRQKLLPFRSLRGELFGPLIFWKRVPPRGAVSHVPLRWIARCGKAPRLH